MALDNLAVTAKPIFDVNRGYWNSGVRDDIQQQHWSRTHIGDRIDIAAWRAFLPRVPRDPYVNARWKRMSWLHLNDTGHVEPLGTCPMAQGGRFNDAQSMADKLRWYSPLESTLVERSDFKAFVRAWAHLWGIGTREPILVQISGIRGWAAQDPLQGQGIHADGCKYLSILVLNRENISGGTNHVYRDKQGTQPLAACEMSPGEILHLRDDKVFHGADTLSPATPGVPFERFIVIINSCFTDGFQNRMLRRHFPQAILNPIFD
ncbi:2OG-Fe dioxygenase family protein [Modicisalibacter luteus]|uniref:2OG-Fe dioxygenase family protein n=1 Tax=Modicisalibacter luteus TaxID=453962 RepID=A0ABV7M0T1_9GAMM|nr:2OG-Fe dioxygenase family protein [Halomonas lutea]GHA92689.1 hypothetical protein GCM10007159_12840 [Halomonas lutea]